MTNAGLAKEAVRAAALLRLKHGIRPVEGLCPYDLATKLGIKVNFISAPSLEGMYSPNPKPALIILNSERPAGRRRYTCGHEIGHHVFDHGYRFDELDEGNSSPWSKEEYLAQRFSAALLMPKLAVDSAFSRRGWKLSNAKPEQTYVVAQELGIGYTTLITNAEINSYGISKSHADALRAVPIPKVREVIVGTNIRNDVFVVDQNWVRPTVDVEVGDLILLPPDARLEGKCASRDGEANQRFLATSQGVANIVLGPDLRSITLRVSKRRYTGFARYRHLEEVSDYDE